MADWTKPTITDLYVDVLNYLAAKDSDSATLFVTASSNQPIGSIRYNRTTNVFQEWNGTAWVDKIVSIAGGGTGANTPSGIVASLGLGTMSIQNANAVNIIGGTIQAITFMSLSCSLGFDSDATRNIGSDAARPNIVYIRNGLVIPVGTDKWVSA
jgi:hypothetical protein